MKSKIIKITVVFLLIWLGSIIKCEIFTSVYGDQFEGEFAQTGMIGGQPEPKVLNLSNTKAKIYYVDESGGDIIVFEKQADGWIMQEWHTVWSKSGSADGFVWPYCR